MSFPYIVGVRFMPTSIRVIRVIDNQYTLDVEIEVDDINTLLNELMKVRWGKKVAHLLEGMLPDVPEYEPLNSKEEAEAEEKRIKENEDRLREEGRQEILKRFDKSPEEIEKDAEGRVRKRYINYIKKKQGRSIVPECFLHYYERLRDRSPIEIAEKLAECYKCGRKSECMSRSNRFVGTIPPDDGDL